MNGGREQESINLVGIQGDFQRDPGLSLGQVRQRGRKDQREGDIWKGRDTWQFTMRPHAYLSLGNGNHRVKCYQEVIWDKVWKGHFIFSHLIIIGDFLQNSYRIEASWMNEWEVKKWVAVRQWNKRGKRKSRRSRRKKGMKRRRRKQGKKRRKERKWRWVSILKRSQGRKKI